VDDEVLEGVICQQDLALQDGQVHLVGSRCLECGATTFPGREFCPRCGGKAERKTLPRCGTLWAYTIQGFAPKPPYIGLDGAFVPYGVGYVDLAGEVLVESRLIAETPEDLRTEMGMELVLVPLGDSRTYAFRPIGAAGAGVQ
jgi:uncharacterized OB-fold protein